MNTLLEQIKKKNAKAFTHSGKFHADDVFSYALLLYLNPAITITRGNKVPKDFDGIVFDIGRGKYDHHQKDSRIRLAHMQGLLDPVHSLVHQGAYLFHILRAFVRHQGILLAADAHRHFIRHVALPFM